MMMPDDSDQIIIPKELLWDYRSPPEDIMWRLQRIADFFPAYGIDKKTVNLLFRYRDKLNMEQGKYRLVEMYYEAWEEKTARKH